MMCATFFRFWMLRHIQIKPCATNAIKILMGCYFIQLVVEKKKKSNLCLRFQIYQYLKKRPLCWTSILVDMCREYNIIVVFWFFLVLKNMFPYFLVFFLVLFFALFYALVDIWMSNWWADRYQISNCKIIRYLYIQNLQKNKHWLIKMCAIIEVFKN